ncbi:MAG: metallophosphoesterase family protein [Candidatus Aminicenantes bacterium]|nr:metallophosphoesterase family protein [Candidatus Aminicenantes bacterium]
MKRKIFLSLLGVVILLVSGSVLQAAMEKGPYLIFPNDNTQMTVLWQLSSTSACTIEWGASTSYGNSIQTSEYGSDYQHKYTITGLSTGTKYFYRVTAESNYFTGSFRTAPAAAATNVKFLAYGDTRSYPADHNVVCGQMVNTYTADPAFQTFNVFAGDWVNDGSTESGWAGEYFSRSQSSALEFQAAVPVMGCMGNHEYDGVLYRKYLPYNFESGGRYFSFDYGPVHVAVVDQYVSYTPGSAQYTWLENDLASTSKPWKVLTFHEPGWSGGGHSNNTVVQEYIQPLCLQYAVKLVFVGHNHYYVRCDVDGIQHITVGGGGAPLYAPSSSYPNVVVAVEDHNFCEIDIQGDQCYVTAKDEQGNVIDYFNMDNTIPPALPWSDGFESGDVETGGWEIAGKVTTDSDSYDGAYSAEINGGGSLTKSISTLGFSDVTVKYARKTALLDAGEFLLVEWSDGTNWYEIEQTQDTGWVYKQFALPAGAGEKASFKLRFDNLGDNREYAYIDLVEISGGSGEPDTTAPTPDPMTFATAPFATGSNSISMTATTASDAAGVEYYFECTAGGGHDSSWQDGATYEDTGLLAETQYTYRVKARDKSPNQNETAYSSTASATTDPQGSCEIYVYDIAMSTTKVGPNYVGQATVWIKDTLGGNVEGATVYGTWSGDVSGPVQGVTGADGKVLLESPGKKGGGTYTITITNVVKTGCTYNASLNVETSDTIIQ